MLKLFALLLVVAATWIFLVGVATILGWAMSTLEALLSLPAWPVMWAGLVFGCGFCFGFVLIAGMAAGLKK
jgi:hypothetical protein